MDIVAFASSFPVARRPRAIQNARLLHALGWHGQLFVPRRRTKAPCESYDGLLPSQMVVRRVPTFYHWRIGELQDRLGLGLHGVPDPHLVWAVLSALYACLAVRRAELMLTISNPPSSHVAGLVFRRLWGRRRPRLPWVAYFSDPWTEWGDAQFVVRKPWAMRVNRRLERLVMSRIDGAAFPSQELADHFLESRPELRGKPVAIIPQSWDPSFDDGTMRPESGPAREGLLLRYVGDFYGPRSPLPLLEALARLRQESPVDFGTLVWELIGRWEEGADRLRCEALMHELGTVSHRGPVPYTQSLAFMRGADVLLHIDIATTCRYFRPSKLIEYLGAKRPILAFCSPGAGERLVKESGGVFADVRDSDQMVGALRELCDLARGGRLEALAPRPEVRAAFAAGVVAARMEEFVQELMACERRGRLE